MTRKPHPLLYDGRTKWERLHKYWTYKHTRKVQKVVLTLLLLSSITFAAWSSYFVFTEQGSPLWGVGSISAIIAVLSSILVSLWVAHEIRKSYRRQVPSIKVVVISSMVILLVLAFGGIEPIASYKDRMQTYLVGDATGEGITSTKPYLPTKVVDNWIFTLGGLKWRSNTVSVELTIENTSTQKVDFVSTFAVQDSAHNWASIYDEPLTLKEMRDKFLSGEPSTSWFEGVYWPGEGRSGKIRFAMGPSSQGVALFLSSPTVRFSPSYTPVFDLPRN